ncbi:hypothetical protein BT69DRAFT_1347396 [Atractiella rhizophila]|nr:hypothetical protein BT69DRAFT_1347396 [Atractiella rhizophila]
MSPKLCYLSLERVNNAAHKEGAINLHITVHPKNVSVTFLDIEGHASTVERDVKSEVDTLASNGNPFIRAFPCFRENAIFVPLASFSQHEGRFHPIDEDESSSPPFLPTASIIQLSVPPPEVIPCTISSLPVELLCLIFSFSDVAFTVSEVCELWRKVSAPYWSEPDSVSGKYTRLNRYPGAGRLWDTLEFYESMDVGMVKEIIAGSPNITTVWMHAFWNEEEAKTVLNAIEGKWLDEVSFGSGSRKWRRDEIENFMRMKGDGIRRLQAHDVEESPASASAGLHLCSRLEYLDLYKYPPLPSLCLPHTVKHLQLSNMWYEKIDKGGHDSREEEASCISELAAPSKQPSKEKASTREPEGVVSVSPPVSSPPHGPPPHPPLHRLLPHRLLPHRLLPRRRLVHLAVRLPVHLTVRLSLRLTIRLLSVHHLTVRHRLPTITHVHCIDSSPSTVVSPTYGFPTFCVFPPVGPGTGEAGAAVSRVAPTAGRRTLRAHSYDGHLH